MAKAEGPGRPLHDDLRRAEGPKGRRAEEPKDDEPKSRRAEEPKSALRAVIGRLTIPYLIGRRVANGSAQGRDRASRGPEVTGRRRRGFLPRRPRDRRRGVAAGRLCSPALLAGSPWGKGHCGMVWWGGAVGWGGRLRAGCAGLSLGACWSVRARAQVAHAPRVGWVRSRYLGRVGVSVTPELLETRAAHPWETGRISRPGPQGALERLPCTTRVTINIFVLFFQSWNRVVTRCETWAR